MNLKKDNIAVSEVLGTILLLMIATTLFSVVLYSVNFQTPQAATPVVNIIGTLEGNNIILEHRGGETLPLNTKIVLEIDGQIIELSANDSNYLNDKSKNNNVWNLGERLVLSGIDITNNCIQTKKMCFK